MESDVIRALLVEDNPLDVRLLHKALAATRGVQFRVEPVGNLTDAINRLAAERYDIVLLDLTLPDSQGLDTFRLLNGQVRDVPVIILTGANDESFALEAVKSGAQDYLVKGQVDGNLLARAMRYAIERHGMQMTLRSLSLIDDLTGLHNRRGFVSLAEQHMKLAIRSRRGLLLIYADLDNLKQINDQYGHREGDCALKSTAEILRKAFRESDVLARIGGDEFAVLALDATSGEAPCVLPNRLQEKVEQWNSSNARPYEIALSFGIVTHDPRFPGTIEELLSRADALMYEQKREKKRANSR